MAKDAANIVDIKNNSEYTEWDTEIYPKGLYDGLLMAHQRYHLPMYITENGVGMYEDVSAGVVKDDYRISFMNDHINALMNAMDDGADVRGYFAWSSFDLYSWKNGCEKRYGLVAVDFKDQNLKRFPKKSYMWYRSVIEENGGNILRKSYKQISSCGEELEINLFILLINYGYSEMTQKGGL